MGSLFYGNHASMSGQFPELVSHQKVFLTRHQKGELIEKKNVSEQQGGDRLQNRMKVIFVGP